MNARIRNIAFYLALGSCLISCKGGKSAAPADSAPTSIEKTKTVEETIEVIVDDATGDTLGIKVNEVGDFYIINPGNEEIIPKEGHSIKVLD